MRIAVGSDEADQLTDFLVKELRNRGHEVVRTGALADGQDPRWPAVGTAVGRLVANGDCDEGVVCCFTGTGVSMAANKVHGVRAALCEDAQTAAGAKQWNHANVLALSLRSTSITKAKEILDAWFSTPDGTGEDAEMVHMLNTMDRGAQLS